MCIYEIDRYVGICPDCRRQDKDIRRRYRACLESNNRSHRLQQGFSCPNGFSEEGVEPVVHHVNNLPQQCDACWYLEADLRDQNPITAYLRQHQRREGNSIAEQAYYDYNPFDLRWTAEMVSNRGQAFVTETAVARADWGRILAERQATAASDAAAAAAAAAAAGGLAQLPEEEEDATEALTYSDYSRHDDGRLDEWVPESVTGFTHNTAFTAVEPKEDLAGLTGVMISSQLLPGNWQHFDPPPSRNDSEFAQLWLYPPGNDYADGGEIFEEASDGSNMLNTPMD